MKLNVIQERNSWWFLSSAIILSGITAMLISCQQIGAPLHLSPDFIGGTQLQFERDCTQPGNCEKPIDINVIREVAKAQGLSNSSIQVFFDKETNREIVVSIKTSNLDNEQRAKLQKVLSENIGTFDPQKNQIDTVSPTLGREMFTSNLFALIISLTGIVIYLSFRFHFDYAICAIVASFHDVLIIVGIFSILGLVLGTEVDSLFIVALFIIAGFSVHHTVVIYDRIREMLQLNPNHLFTSLVNQAINQTLARSLNTTLIVLLPSFAIFLIGGETLKNFALVLIIGFTVGVYSSIFITGSLLVAYRESIDRASSSGPISKKASPLLVLYRKNINGASSSGPISKRS